MLRYPMIILLPLLLTGCERSCTDELRFGLKVTVIDGATGSKVCDATVTAHDGAYQETLSAFPPGDCHFLGAGERPGSYSITARSGANEKTVTGVAVIHDSCHVVTRDVTISF